MKYYDHALGNAKELIINPHNWEEESFFLNFNSEKESEIKLSVEITTDDEESFTFNMSADRLLTLNVTEEPVIINVGKVEDLVIHLKVFKGPDNNLCMMINNQPILMEIVKSKEAAMVKTRFHI